jgi:hypothetical protein
MLSICAKNTNQGINRVCSTYIAIVSCNYAIEVDVYSVLNE